MKNGDISNRSAPVVAFRVEDFLIHFKDTTLSDKIANFVVGKERRAELDENVLAAMNYIFRHTDMTVELVMEIDNFHNTSMLKLLEHLPYNRIVSIVKPVEVAILLNVGDMSYYVDDNEERRSLIGHKYCVTLEELNLLMRGRS